MASDYPKGIFIEPIEKRRIKAAKAFTKLINEKYGAKVEVDEKDLSIKIIPHQVTIDELLKLREMARAVALGFSPSRLYS